jgi:hypothetical protein
MPKNQPAARAADPFPCGSFSEAAVHLRRPLPPAAVRFKVQTVADRAAQVVAYVTARQVTEVLNRVVPGGWRALTMPLAEALQPEPLPDEDGRPLRYAVCHLRIHEADFFDVGEGVEPKALFSDALKRAAVRAGVGSFTYAMASPWLGFGERDHELRVNRKGRPYIDERTEAWLRAGYEAYLKCTGIRAFGQPLELGDDPDAGAGERAPENGAGETPATDRDRRGHEGKGREAAPSPHRRAEDRARRAPVVEFASRAAEDATASTEDATTPKRGAAEEAATPDRAAAEADPLNALAEAVLANGYTERTAQRLLALRLGQAAGRAIAWEQVDAEIVTDVAAGLAAARHIGLEEAQLAQAVKDAARPDGQSGPKRFAELLKTLRAQPARRGGRRAA